MGHFVGTASFYSEFRPGYPDGLWDSLVTEAEVDESSRVLDLGCGPGTATLPLAERAGHVVAVDLDSEMVRHGRRLADEHGITNVEWVNVGAESVAYPERYFQLIVSASAFHWMDRTLVAAKCLSMLSEDGALALLGNPTPLMQVRERTGVGAAITEVQDRWFGISRRRIGNSSWPTGASQPILRLSSQRHGNEFKAEVRPLSPTRAGPWTRSLAGDRATRGVAAGRSESAIGSDRE